MSQEEDRFHSPNHRGHDLSTNRKLACGPPHVMAAAEIQVAPSRPGPAKRTGGANHRTEPALGTPRQSKLQAQTSRQEEKSRIPESCLQQSRGSPAGDAGSSREHRGRDQGLKAALESSGNPGRRRSLPGPKTQAMPRAVQCLVSGTRGTLDRDPHKPLDPGVVPKRSSPAQAPVEEDVSKSHRPCL